MVAVIGGEARLNIGEWNQKVDGKMGRVGMVSVVTMLMLFSWPEMAIAAQSSVNIENIAARPHGVSPSTSTAQLAAAIRRGVGEQSWVVLSATRGTIVAKLNRRSHEAIVTVGYDNVNFWIDYKDSVNLNYSPDAKCTAARTKPYSALQVYCRGGNQGFRSPGRSRGGRWRLVPKGPVIHPNYNRWVADLATGLATTEVAGVNELPSRTAPGKSTGRSLRKGSNDGPSVAPRLEALKALEVKGLISKSEASQARLRILEDL